MAQYTHTVRTTYKIESIIPNVVKFDELYRRVRGDMKKKLFNCEVCRKPFQDGNFINLLVTNKGNKAACHNCADKFNKELRELGESLGLNLDSHIKCVDTHRKQGGMKNDNTRICKNVT